MHPSTDPGAMVAAAQLTAAARTVVPEATGTKITNRQKMTTL